MTHDEYTDKIRDLYNKYSGSFSQTDYAAMRRIVSDNLSDYYDEKIENKLLFETCKVWQSIHPRTCPIGLNAKYKAVLATIKDFI